MKNNITPSDFLQSYIFETVKNYSLNSSLPVVYVKCSNSIAVVLYRGSDSSGSYFRTDSDGIKGSHEIEPINSNQEYRSHLAAGANIAETTRQLIRIKRQWT